MSTAPLTDRRNFYQSLIQREQASRSAERKRRALADPFSTIDPSTSPMPNLSTVEEYQMTQVSCTGLEPESALRNLAQNLKKYEKSLAIQKRQQEDNRYTIVNLKDKLRELKRLSDFYHNKIYQDELEMSELGKRSDPSDPTLKFSFGPVEPALSSPFRSLALLKQKLAAISETNRSETLDNLEKHLQKIFTDLQTKEKLASEVQAQLFALNDCEKPKNPHKLLSGIKCAVDFAQKRLQAVHLARELDSEIVRLKSESKQSTIHISRPSMYNKSLHFSSLKELPKLAEDETEQSQNGRNNLLNVNKKKVSTLTEFDPEFKKAEKEKDRTKLLNKQVIIKEISTASLSKYNSANNNSQRSTIAIRRSKLLQDQKILFNYSKLADKTFEKQDYCTLKPNVRKTQIQHPTLSRSQHEVGDLESRDPLSASLHFYKANLRKNSREPRLTPSFYDKFIESVAHGQPAAHLYFPDRNSPTLYHKFAHNLNAPPMKSNTEVSVPFESNIKDEVPHYWMQLQKETRPSARQRPQALLKSQNLDRQNPRSRSITPLNLPSSLSYDPAPTNIKLAPGLNKPYPKLIPSLRESKFITSSKIDIISVKSNKISTKPIIDTPKFSEISARKKNISRVTPEILSFQDLSKKSAFNQETTRTSRHPGFKKYITIEALPSDSGKTSDGRARNQISGVKATPSSISSLIFKKLAVNRFK